MDLGQKIPPYLTDKGNIFKLILFTALFALIFINIYSPFELTTWVKSSRALDKFHNLEFVVFIYSSIIILTGVLVVVISRIIMYQVTRFRGRISISQYLFWIFIEIVSMASFYALYERVFLDTSRSFFVTFKISIQNTALVLLLPYSISWLYFSWIDKNIQLKQMQASEGITESKELITFRDEKGTMRISMKMNDLLYLQAADNYVTIVYNQNNKLAKYMLRSSLKILSDEMEQRPFVRCHRSYMVNFEKVKIIRREKDGIKLELDTDEITEIPVSKTYIDDVFKAFGYSD